MSMTVTMNEAGLLVLPEAVRRYLKLEGAAQLELNVQDDVITLRPETNDNAEEAPFAKVEYRDGFPVITGIPQMSGDGIVAAIRAGREERDARVAGTLLHK